MNEVEIIEALERLREDAPGFLSSAEKQGDDHLRLLAQLYRYAGELFPEDGEPRLFIPRESFEKLPAAVLQLWARTCFRKNREEVYELHRIDQLPKEMIEALGRDARDLLAEEKDATPLGRNTGLTWSRICETLMWLFESGRVNQNEMSDEILVRFTEFRNEWREYWRETVQGMSLDSRFAALDEVGKKKLHGWVSTEELSEMLLGLGEESAENFFQILPESIGERYREERMNLKKRDSEDVLDHRHLLAQARRLNLLLTESAVEKDPSDPMHSSDLKACEESLEQFNSSGAFESRVEASRNLVDQVSRMSPDEEGERKIMAGALFSLTERNISNPAILRCVWRWYRWCVSEADTNLSHAFEEETHSFTLLDVTVHLIQHLCLNAYFDAAQALYAEIHDSLSAEVKSELSVTLKI